jgi:hypothetical protein
VGNRNKRVHNQQVAGIDKKLLVVGALFHESVVKTVKKQSCNDDKETGDDK